MNVVDGGSNQEDQDSMGELLVQKKNVLLDADGKETAIGLPSPISSKSFGFFLDVFSYMRKTLRDILYQCLRERDTPVPQP
jgi:hypothetical protein